MTTSGTDQSSSRWWRVRAATRTSDPLSEGRTTSEATASSGRRGRWCIDCRRMHSTSATSRPSRRWSAQRPPLRPPGRRTAWCGRRRRASPNRCCPGRDQPPSPTSARPTGPATPGSRRHSRWRRSRGRRGCVAAAGETGGQHKEGSQTDLQDDGVTANHGSSHPETPRCPLVKSSREMVCSCPEAGSKIVRESPSLPVTRTTCPGRVVSPT